VREFHRPALLSEVIEILDPHPGGVYVDCTFGGGGHARAILERIGPGGRLVGIDRDQDAIERATTEFAGYGDSLILVHGNFANLENILRGLSIGRVAGVILDLGVSSFQLDTQERGFSLSGQAPIDMRMDKTEPTTAAELLAKLPEQELADLIRRYSDERWAKRIARMIVRRRQESPIRTTDELAAIVAGAIPAAAHPPNIHPATRTFQALRIAVNREMESLEQGLSGAAKVLEVGGRLLAISWHSIEDRAVKQFFAAGLGRCQCPRGLPQCVCGARQYLRVITKKPVTPSAAEVQENPRARSAKLRAAEKIDEV
jgi:16S rRNA (cytosine1402-N4)-methyltransferase